MSTWKYVAAGGIVVGIIGAVALRRERRPDKIRVALIGDSYAVGLGPELINLLPDFKFEGHKGTNTSQWASHSTQCVACGDWLAEFKPDTVLVSLGVNDGDRPNPATYQAIVRMLHGTGARVAWILPPAAVNVPNTRSVIASLGIPTVPATQTPLAVDGLHPKSYAPWAREIAKALS